MEMIYSKKAATLFADMRKQYNEANADGNLHWSEIMGLSANVPRVLELADHVDEIADESKNADHAAREDFRAHLDSLDLASPEIEKLIFKVVDGIIAAHQIVTEITD